MRHQIVHERNAAGAQSGDRVAHVALIPTSFGNAATSTPLETRVGPGVAAALAVAVPCVGTVQRGAGKQEGRPQGAHVD